MIDEETVKQRSTHGIMQSDQTSSLIHVIAQLKENCQPNDTKQPSQPPWKTRIEIKINYSQKENKSAELQQHSKIKGHENTTC